MTTSELPPNGGGSGALNVVCGGFPCQPFSSNGFKKGTADARWGWPWFADVIRHVRPGYVIVENVGDLVRPQFSDAFAAVLSDLHELGFDAEWSIVSACSLGAPHTRERLFLVAYPQGVDGQIGLGAGPARQGALPRIDERAGAWRDHVDRALEASRADDREADGSARRMVTAGGNAVVPVVAEYVGRLLVAHHAASLERAS